MPIKEPILFITIDDFKSWKGFDKLLFENVTNSDENIWFAISVASSNIDYFSGFAISKKWPEQTPTSFTDNVQTATAHYVRFLCTKGVDYTRGQASMAQGGIVYSESNPEDPYYIPPEVFNCLRNIKEYTAFQGFNLNVKPKTSFFSQFLSNKGEINPLENYLQITNAIAGFGLKIVPTHPVNIMGTVLTFSIDPIAIIPKSENLFNVCFSNDAFQIVDGKQGQQAKVISLSDNIPNVLINEANYDTLQTTNKTVSGAINEIKTVNDNQTLHISQLKTIVNNNSDVITDLLDKKQNKLIAGTNIIIDENTNTISATGSNQELPKWVTVAITKDFDNIFYNLKTNTKYKLYYNTDEIVRTSKIGDGTYKAIEFFYNGGDNIVEDYVVHGNPSDEKYLMFFYIVIQAYSNSKSSGINLTHFYPTNHRYGQLWKLEELQRGG